MTTNGHPSEIRPEGLFYTLRDRMQRMLKPVIVQGISFACIALVTGSALARQNTLKITCDAAQAYIKLNAPVAVKIGPHTYVRFVARRRDCQDPHIASWITVPTRDNPTCHLGPVCVVEDLFD